MPDVGGKEFYSALHKQAIAEVENIFKSVLYPVQFPAQGDFHPEWHDLNDVFNKATLGYIDALVSPGDFPGTVKLSAPNGFLNAYVQVIAAIDFTLSEHDTHVVTKAEGNARASAGILISDYQEKFKTITQKQMDDAGVANKQDYISYIIGNIWSGTEAANKSPLTAKIMAEARDLMDLLPALPSSGDLVVTDYLTYLGDMSPAVTQQTRQALGRYFLRSLKRNSGSPNLDNGGMKTVDPEQNTISDGYEPKYEINKSPAAIYGELTDKDRKITLSMEISQASGSDSSVSVEGQAGFSIGSWLSFGVEGGASYDMSKAQGTSMDCTVLMEFEGYSMFPTVPLAWDQATNVGWYYDQPIAEAVKNADKDVTGFKFLGTPPTTTGTRSTRAETSASSPTSSSPASQPSPSPTRRPITPLSRSTGARKPRAASPCLASSTWGARRVPTARASSRTPPARDSASPSAPPTRGSRRSTTPPSSSAPASRTPVPPPSRSPWWRP